MSCRLRLVVSAVDPGNQSNDQDTRLSVNHIAQCIRDAAQCILYGSGHGDRICRPKHVAC